MGSEQILIRQEDGAKRVILTVDGEEASECWIIPLTIRVGVAMVRVDGIGGVETKPEHRLKGYASRVLRRAMEEMAAGDAAITMLYGISDFYHRFGYVTAGPEFGVFLHAEQIEEPLPLGWTVREFTPEDLPAVQSIYERATALATGAVVRAASSRAWHKLLETPGSYPQDECWVAVSPQGAVEGYAWRARWCWPIRDVLEHEFPDALTFGEVIAVTPSAADALLATCRRRTAEEGKDETLLPVPPDSLIAVAARYIDARHVQLYSANGGSMVRVLNVERLLRALEPELGQQIRQSGQKVAPCRLTFRTELGEGMLVIDREGARVVQAEDRTTSSKVYLVHLSQGTLARLALGFAPAEDLCARLGEPLPEEVVALFKILFPVRYQHAYLPDRY
ncbi:MAG: GNAT family N-acetyltransferase [Armatimonadota bacterium]|nr:GNAT family N-acetyltransferase [bacterium]MDW8319733.1 GNAT family N-acetyltransferase [Armatimonadota bacterium]